MFWKLIGRNIFYPLAIFLAVSLWLFTTESGCKASFWIIKTTVPGELKIETIEGKWTDRLILKNLDYKNSSLNLSLKEAVIDPDIKALMNSNIQIPFLKVKNASFVWKEKPASPIYIENGVGQIEMTFNFQNMRVDIKHITGTWREMILEGHAKIYRTDKHFQLPTGMLTLGENKISISESRHTKNQFEWSLNLNTAKKVKLNLNGYLVPEQKQNHWSGQLLKGDYSSEGLGSWRLKVPSRIKLSSTDIAISDITLQNNTSRLQIKGDFYYNKQGLDSNLNLASLFVPKQALTLKNLHLNISGPLGKPLQLNGSGYSGAGKFQIDGTMQFNDAKKFSVNLSGKNLKIYNTRNIQIQGSPQLTLNLINNNLFVQGNLQIHQAYIAIQDQKNVALLSKDIVLINPSESTQTNHGLRIIPSIYVIIENNLHFEGYGIDGIVGGKLAINERPDGLLTGDGKLTIKDGKYRLQGATRYIHRGYLLFPPGTLLKDPLLDILISQNRSQQHADMTSPNIGLYVQGTLLHPIYHAYSNDSSLKSADILSRLGFGQSETSGDENQRQLYAQTAFLFSGTANPFIDFLQKNLNLEEFNLESKPINKTFYTQGGTDTVLVIGKSLSEKLYLQYLQSIIEPITTIRLKYFLTQYFTVSGETGTQGLGGDLTFSMDRD